MLSNVHAVIAYTGEPDAVCPITFEPLHTLEHPVAFIAHPSVPYEARYLVQWLYQSRTVPHTNLPTVDDWNDSLADIIAPLNSESWGKNPAATAAFLLELAPSSSSSSSSMQPTFFPAWLPGAQLLNDGFMWLYVIGCFYLLSTHDNASHYSHAAVIVLGIVHTHSTIKNIYGRLAMGAGCFALVIGMCPTSSRFTAILWLVSKSFFAVQLMLLCIPNIASSVERQNPVVFSLGGWSCAFLLIKIAAHGVHLNANTVQRVLSSAANNANGGNNQAAPPANNAHHE